MATIRTKLRELRDADVRFISLVDRAATRIPFRVLKRNKETEMGIDLTKIFKADKPKPVVAEVAVFAQTEAAVAEEVRKAIETAGFQTHHVRKADEETLVYAQGPQVGGDTVMIRLSDQMVVSMRHLPTPEGLFGDVVKEYGFYPSLSVAQNILGEQLTALVEKGDTAGARAAMNSFSEYMAILTTLPASCYEADAAVTELVQKAVTPPLKPESHTEDGEPAPVVVEPVDKNVKQIDAPGMQPNGGSVTGPVTPSEASDGGLPLIKKEDPPTEPTETPAPAPVAEPVAQKTDLQVMLDAIAGLEERVGVKVADVATKVDNVVQEQSTYKKTLDGIVSKAENLESKLSTTVVASASPEDRPAGKDIVAKSDTDPRTGCFDTAFLRRTR